MRIYTRENGESGWAPVAIIMTALVVVMAMGYFMWYAPSQRVAATPTRDVIVNTPASAAPPATNTVVVPGPAGAQGATGTAGAAGADGADGAPGSSRHHHHRDDSDSSSDGGSKTGDSTDNSNGSSDSGTTPAGGK